MCDLSNLLGNERRKNLLKKVSRHVLGGTGKISGGVAQPSTPKSGPAYPNPDVIFVPFSILFLLFVQQQNDHKSSDDRNYTHWTFNMILVLYYLNFNVM